MPSPPSYGCCTRVNFVLKKHLLFQMNLSNSGLKNRSIKEYWLIFTVLKFPLGLQFSHNLTKFKIIKYISTIYIMTTTCTYLQQLTQVSDVAHGPLVKCSFTTCFTFYRWLLFCILPLFTVSLTVLVSMFPPPPPSPPSNPHLFSFQIWFLCQNSLTRELKIRVVGFVLKKLFTHFEKFVLITCPFYSLLYCFGLGVK